MKKKEIPEEEKEFEDGENVFDNEENEAPKDKEKEKYILPHTVDLRQPFDYGNKTYTKIIFQNELEFGMWAHLPAGEGMKLGHTIPMIVGMTGEIREVIKKLRPADAKECMEVAQSFLTLGEDAAETGEQTSDI